MAYYLLIEAEVLDADRYAVYREAVTPVIARYGGRFLVRGGEVEAVRGGVQRPTAGRNRVRLQGGGPGLLGLAGVRADQEAARGGGHRRRHRGRGRVTGFYFWFEQVFDNF